MVISYIKSISMTSLISVLVIRLPFVATYNPQRNRIRNAKLMVKKLDDLVRRRYDQSFYKDKECSITRNIKTLGILILSCVLTIKNAFDILSPNCCSCPLLSLVPLIGQLCGGAVMWLNSLRSV